MKELLSILIVGIIIGVVAPVAAIEINFTNITAVYGIPYCESGSGCPAQNLIDGNTATWLTLDQSHGQVQILTDDMYEWTSCDIYHGRPDGNREVLIRFNSSSNPVTTYGIAIKGGWTTINIPAGNKSQKMFFSTTDSPWFGLNEIKCEGTKISSPTEVPSISFIGSPVYGSKPLTVNFNATVSPTASIFRWNFGDGDISNISQSTTSHEYINEGIYSVRLDAYSVSYGWQNTSMSEYISVGNMSGIELILDIKDAYNPSSYITGATASIQNMTSGVWGNTTANTGGIIFVDVGGLPLSVGQSVKLCANKTGYSPECKVVTIPYSGYIETLYLTDLNHAATGGNWNLIVKVIRNLDQKPINGASVTLSTGVTGWQPGMQGTNADGVTSFMNVSPSTMAMVDVVAQGYKSGSAVVSVIPNSTQHVTIELVQIGHTPVETPITPGPTGTGATPEPTAVPYPTVTDIHGNPITTNEGIGWWSIAELVKYLPMWVKAVACMVTLALMWGILYWARGGKYRKHRNWK